MPAAQTFTAFFSYAHHDAETDPELIDALTTRLEKRVSGKILNARLRIWRDARDVRAADRWNATIEAAVRNADLFIVLLTPKWIESNYCRKEYLIFEEVEASRDDGDYVVPVLAQAIDGHRHHLLPEQKPIYDSIQERQYFEVLASDFLALSDRNRDSAIDKIADDIAGIIERRREAVNSKPLTTIPRLNTRRSSTNIEIYSRAQNFSRVRFVSGEEVLIDRPQIGHSRGIYAQADFIERLFVEADNARVEFGIRRTFVILENHGGGRLSKVDDFDSARLPSAAYYVELLEKPDAITVCADPAFGKTSLTELALPPAEGENRYSRIARASDDVDAANLRGELRVLLDAEGLHISESFKGKLTQAKRTQIKAIIQQAARQCYHVSEIGEICLPMPVREREG